jgi:hypothetical protein
MTNLSGLEELDIITPDVPAIFVLAYTAQGKLIGFANSFATGR